jgi:hypothetical protein
MNRVAIVPANEFFKLDAAAVFRDLTEAILFHARNLNELRRTRNLQVGNFWSYPLRWPLPDGSEKPPCAGLMIGRRLDRPSLGTSACLDRSVMRWSKLPPFGSPYVIPHFCIRPAGENWT